MCHFTLKQMIQAVENGTWHGKYFIGDVGYEFFNNKKYLEELKYMESSEVFLEMRLSMLMTIVPKKMTKKDKGQAAYLRAAISRVSTINYIYMYLIHSYYIFKIYF